MVVLENEEKVKWKRQQDFKELLWSFYHAGVEYGKLNKQNKGGTNGN